MNKWINFNCTVEEVKSRKDRSLKVILSTPELPPSEGAILLSLANTQGHCYISPNALQEAQMIIPPEDDTPTGKTPSQRLRSRLFVYYTEYLKKDSKDFREWYGQKLEEIGNVYLDKMRE